MMPLILTSWECLVTAWRWEEREKSTHLVLLVTAETVSQGFQTLRYSKVLPRS